MNSPARVVTSPLFIRMCRTAVGLVLLAAALAKLGEPAALAAQIRHFHILPGGPENVLAITLPWIELLAALALVSGLHARPGAWIALALMVVFTLAVAQAMARGLNFECGCFGTGDAARIGLKKLLENIALTGVALAGSQPAARVPPGVSHAAGMTPDQRAP